MNIAHKKYKIIIFVFLIFLLSSCSILTDENTENEHNLEMENENIELTKVLVHDAERLSFDKELSLSGTIIAKDEVTIASEVSGTVAKLLKKEGDKINENEAFMKLESGSNLLNISYLSAKDSLKNAERSLFLTKKTFLEDIKNTEKSLSLTKESSLKDLENAKLQVNTATLQMESAKVEYERLKKSKEFTKNTDIANKQGSEKSIEIAEKNLEISKTTLEDIKKNEKRIENNILENMVNTISLNLIPLRSNMIFIDSLIGASEFREHDNDLFEIYLAGSKQNLMEETKILWTKTNPLLEELEIRFNKIDKLKFSLEDANEIKILLSKVEEKSKIVRKMLRNLESMLYGSIVSVNFTIEKINSLKADISSLQKVLSSNLQSIDSLNQQSLDFSTQSPQRINKAELNISLRESELAARRDSLLTVENSGSLSDINIDSSINNAKNNYNNAKNNLKIRESQVKSIKVKAGLSEQSVLSQIDSIKAQSKLSEQSALSQIDSAQAMLDQSSLQLSKLEIKSGLKGVITKIMAVDGDSVSPGTPLAIVSDFSSLKLVTDVSIEESLLLKKGMKAKIQIDGIKKEIEGKLSIVYPEADKSTRRIRVEILVDNNDDIPANIFATAKIILQKQKPEIFIPLSSLISQNPPTIFVVEKQDNKFFINKKFIELGEKNNNMVAVIKGLRKNEKVVTEKYDTVFDGDEVSYEYKDYIKEKDL
jgi:RND family efflux transporter MFP subunit